MDNTIANRNVECYMYGETIVRNVTTTFVNYKMWKVKTNNKDWQTYKSGSQIVYDLWQSLGDFWESRLPLTVSMWPLTV
jgi:hypothetical protein